MEAMLILFAISAICCVMLLYPYVIYPFLLARMRKIPIEAKPFDCSVSLLFCAFNESNSLATKITNLHQLKLDRPDLQILVYDDGSSDDTVAKLAQHPDLLTLVQGSGRRGKAAGMKHLASLAQGEVLIFTDANVICAPDAIAKLLPYYGNPEIGGVCGTLCYENEVSSSTSEVGARYWNLDEKLRALESDTGNVMGADGSIFSIRRSLYPTFPDTVLDDFTVSMSVVFAGKRLVKAPDVLAFEKGVVRRDEEFRRKMRIGARAYHTHAWMRRHRRKMVRLDRFKYTSRKLVRWFGGAFLIIGAATGLAALAMVSVSAFVAISAVTGLGLLAALRAKSGFLAKIGDIILALIATLIGVIRGMSGNTVVTWAPATSR